MGLQNHIYFSKTTVSVHILQYTSMNDICVYSVSSNVVSKRQVNPYQQASPSLKGTAKLRVQQRQNLLHLLLQLIQILPQSHEPGLQVRQPGRSVLHVRTSLEPPFTPAFEITFTFEPPFTPAFELAFTFALAVGWCHNSHTFGRGTGLELVSLWLELDLGLWLSWGTSCREFLQTCTKFL